jgi:predicted NACHT family NTPase
LIANYLRALPGNQLEPSTIELNSAAVLKSIEGQHGLLIERARRIYSFSHLTFQEYFTARAIVAASESSLPQLVRHLSEKRWREVFLLTAQMLPDANLLLQLMQQQIDRLVFTEFQNLAENATATHAATSDESLQQFLMWVIQKALEVKTSYKPAAVRAFYLTLALPPHHQLTGNQALALAIDPKLASEVGGELALDLALAHALAVAVALTPELIPDRLKPLYLALDLDYLTDAEPIGHSLQQLKKQLPQVGEDRECLKEWWQVNGQAWASQLRALLIRHRNIGHEWHLSEAALQLLEQYGTGHKLLVDCLNSNCQITPTVRQEIEDKLLLPLRID